MSWFRVDDGMLNHPKWRRAIKAGGCAVVHLWLAMGTWCSTHLTDGLVPADMLSEIPGPRGKRTRERALRALAEQHLVVLHGDGSVLLHDYLDYNPSRADVTAERERWAKSKRNQRVTDIVPMGHSRESRASPGVPSRPVPSRPPESDPERAHADSVPEVPGLDRVAGVARTYSMPSEIPPKDYLDEALMRSVSLDQARSTWEHYHGAGLPPGGVEKLYPWLCKRAKERANQLARVPAKAGARAVTVEPTGKMLAFAQKHGLELEPFLRKLDEQRVAEQLGAGRALEILGHWLSKAVREREIACNT